MSSGKFCYILQSHKWITWVGDGTAMSHLCDRRARLPLFSCLSVATARIMNHVPTQSGTALWSWRTVASSSSLPQAASRILGSCWLKTPCLLLLYWIRHSICDQTFTHVSWPCLACFYWPCAFDNIFLFVALLQIIHYPLWTSPSPFFL